MVNMGKRGNAMRRFLRLMRHAGTLILCSALLLTMFWSPDSFHVHAKESGVRDFVTRLYNICLERDPDAAGLESWVACLLNGTSGADVAFGFLFSTEFKERNLCEDCYVTNLYRCFLGREPDAAGKEDWLNTLAAGQTRGSVFNGFVGSQEFTDICESYGIVRGTGDWSAVDFAVTGVCTECGGNDSSVTVSTEAVKEFVTRLYNVCLDRNPDTTGLQSWMDGLMNGAAGAETAYGFIFSSEFRNKNLCAEHFVEYMYKAFFNRDADPIGKASWVSALNNGKTRGFVFSGFTGSQEFVNLCAAYGIKPGNQDYSSIDFGTSGKCVECENAGSTVAASSTTALPKSETKSSQTSTATSAPEHQHTYGDWNVTKQPTCEADGVETRTCTSCGATETRSIAAAGHSYGAWTVKTAATCEKDGVKERTCKICGSTETQVIPSTGHNYSAWTTITVATCTTTGERTHSCKTCGKVVTETTPVNTTTGHRIVITDTVKEASCDSVGYVNKKCQLCGEMYYNVLVPPQGHAYSSEYTTVEPTCTTAGSRFRECTREGCNSRTNVTSIPAAGHTWSEDIRVEATCTESGSITRECLDCSAVKLLYTLNSLGHDYVYESNGDGNCLEPGTETGTCTRCGNTITRNENKVYDDHDWVEHAAVPATCTETGTTAYRSCSRCGAVDGEPEVIPAVGHQFDGNVIISGNSVYSCNTVATRTECTRCGEYSEWQIIKSGHGHDWKPTGETYEYEGQPDLPVYQCSICGLTYPYTTADGTDTQVIPRTVWGILYYADPEYSEGWDGASLYTLTGRIGVDKSIEVDAPAAKPGYHFVGWRIFGSNEEPTGDIHRKDDWLYMDYVFEAVYEPDGTGAN